MRLRLVHCQTETQDQEAPAVPDPQPGPAAPSASDQDWLRALAARIDALDGCWQGALLDLLAGEPLEAPEAGWQPAHHQAHHHRPFASRGHARRRVSGRYPFR